MHQKKLRKKIADLQMRKNESSNRRKKTYSYHKKTFMTIEFICETYVYRRK